MIEDIYIDPDTNDLALDEEGNLLWVDGAPRVRQQVQARLDLQLGDWFRDSSVGVDWINRVLIKSNDTVLAQSEIVREILATPGVARIDSIELTVDPTTRRLTVIWTATTDDDIAIGGTVVG